jgi:peptide/nickel transport system substrate-binding protein
MVSKYSAMWKLMLLVVSVSLVVIAVGCGPTPAPAAVPATATQAVEAKAPSEVVLVVGVANQYGETFDIFNTSTTMEPHNMIYEPLVTVDYNYKFQPGLAERWEASEDGLTWTFYLKKGVKFHDGTDFNAEVVKWWLEGMQKGVNSYMFESMTEAKVIDEHTIALTFSGPFPNLLYNLSTSFSGIMSKAAYEKYGDEYGTKYAVGTGPFMLQEWVQNDHLLLVKNPDYNWAPEWTGHQGPAKVDKILYRIIPEDATRVIELQAGNVHLLLSPPPPREQAQFKDNPDYFYTQSPAATIQFIGMNVNDPLCKDLRTRQAIGHAIDRDLIFETIYQGLGRPTTTYLAAELGGDKGVAEVAPSYDPDKARALLAEVGWKPGSDGILVADNVAGVDKGTKFEVSYWTYQEDEYKRLAEATQKMLADVGIKANTQLMDNPTYSDQLKGGSAQLILRQYEWDNNDILEWFHHSKYLPYPNYLGVKDTVYDEMLDDANYKTPTWEDRDAKYVKIHKHLIEKWYPWAPIRQAAYVYIGRSTVKDFKPVPLRGSSSTELWTQVYLEQ